MPDVQASLTPDGTLFFWMPDGSAQEGIAQGLSELGARGQARNRPVVQPHDGMVPRRTPGMDVEIAQAAPALARLPAAQPVSDSVRCWSLASRLALELASRQRVVPTVRDGQARWQALLSRAEDRERFRTLVAVLPVASRAVPASSRGEVRLPTAEIVLRRFVDTTVDSVYRQGVYPGPARGWELEFAEALRGEDASFHPRSARFLGVPAMLQAWTREAEATGLRVGMSLSLPSGNDVWFGLEFWLHPTDRPDLRVDVDAAWKAGAHLEVAGRRHEHPAHALVRGLARAARVFPPLIGALASDRPRNLRWDAHAVWKFFSEGAEPLRDAGFRVAIPPAFEKAGHQRLRARMHVVAQPAADGSIDLSDTLRFRWEVVLGDTVVDGDEFAELCARGEPVVRFRGGWVLLDPQEISRLPAGLPQEGTLPAAVALRAILVGEYEGVPVIADHHLDLVIRALREPPEEPIPKGLRGTLRHYQKHGFSWLATLGRLGLGACLADDMGLGKTIQVMAHLLRRVEEGRGPHLVVSPTSVLANWQDELDRFAPSLAVVRYHGLHRESDALNDADVVLTTYGVLARDIEELCDVAWDVVVLDEAQAIKNPDARRAHAARKLPGKHRIAMTGTPIENRLEELWSLMEFLAPGLLGPRSRFRREVAVPVERFGDQDVAERLRRGVSPFLLRRVKTDPTVIADLPDKIEHRKYCTLTPEQAELYERVVEERLDRISSAEGMERRGQVLAMLTELKQVCNHPSQYLGDDGPYERRSGKLETAVELLDAVFEAGERVLVFTQYREMGDRLQTHLENLYGERPPFLHGGTPATRRETMVRSFQEDEDAPPVLIVSLRAGGTGLNLTAATHVLHYDRWWNPAVEDQATDRAYRIGQRHNVFVHKLVTVGTLEERVDRLLEEKRELAEQIVGGGEGWVSELDDDALRALVSLGADAREGDE